MRLSATLNSCFLLLISSATASSFFSLWGYNEGPWNVCAAGEKSHCSCSSDLLETMTSGLDCSNKQIQTISNDMVIPKQYTIVDFSGNNISHVEKLTFLENNTHVLTLRLSANRLSCLLPQSFANLPSLRRLDLSNNIISNISDEAFSGLVDLEVLDLSYNRITDLPASVFSDKTNLSELDLEYNPIKTLADNVFHGLSSLRVLDLTFLQLKTIHEITFQGLRIEDLTLVHNEFKQIPTKALYQLRSTLKTLDLSGNNFEIIPANSLYNLPHLETLRMEQMIHLKSIESFAFTELPNLRTVVLKYLPKFMFIDERAFVSEINGTENRSPVQDFTISYSILTNIPEELLYWDQLKYLNLHNNHWKCDCNLRWIKGSAVENLVGDKLFCTSPNRVRGSLISWLKEEDFVCRPHDLPIDKWQWGTIVLIGLVGVLVSVTTVSILFYRRHGYLCRPPADYNKLIASSEPSLTVLDVTNMRTTVASSASDTEIDTNIHRAAVNDDPGV